MQQETGGGLLKEHTSLRTREQYDTLVRAQYLRPRAKHYYPRAALKLRKIFITHSPVLAERWSLAIRYAAPAFLSVFIQPDALGSTLIELFANSFQKMSLSWPHEKTQRKLIGGITLCEDVLSFVTEFFCRGAKKKFGFLVS